MTRTTKLQWTMRQIHQQVIFMASCGGTLAGYVDKYGIPGKYKEVEYRGKTHIVPAWSGNGGRAIYEADKARLNQLYQEFRSLVGRQR